MTDHRSDRGLDRRRDPIFVGYLPTPTRDRWFLGRSIPILLVVVAIIAAGLSSDQRPPGDGVWDLSTEVVLEGELVPGPYPVIRVADPEAVGGVRTWLLVEPGKFGTVPRLRELGIGDESGTTPVRARGFRIERDGRAMLELLPGADGLEIVDGGTIASPPLETVRLEPTGSFRGEIVDAKCWLGVMKPGAGKPHKACATLCIDGGVPPMLVWLDEEGRRRRAIVVGEDGESIVARFRMLVADPVVLVGRLEQRDDLVILRVDADDDAIRRAG